LEIFEAHGATMSAADKVAREKAKEIWVRLKAVKRVKRRAAKRP
jgi:hypothetical protein